MKERRNTHRTGTYLDYQHHLSGEYRDTLEQIEAFCRAKTVSAGAFDEIMNYVTDLFLTAQEDGRPVETVTGGDIEGFCQGLFSELPLQNRLTALLEKGTRIFALLLSYVLLYVFIPALRTDIANAAELKALFTDGRISADKLLLLFAVTVLLIMAQPFTRLNALQSKRRLIFGKIADIALYLIALAGICGMPAVLGLTYTPWVVLAVLLIGLAICISAAGFTHRANGEPFLAVREDFDTASLANTVQSVRQEYDEQNTALAKKNKSPLSHQEFMANYFQNTRRLGLCCLLNGAMECVLMVLCLLEAITVNGGTLPLLYKFIYVIAIVNLLLIAFDMNRYFERNQLRHILEKDIKSPFDEDIFDYLKQL